MFVAFAVLMLWSQAKCWCVVMSVRMDSDRVRESVCMCVRVYVCMCVCGWVDVSWTCTLQQERGLLFEESVCERVCESVCV